MDEVLEFNRTELLKELKTSKSVFKPLFGNIWLQMPGQKIEFESTKTQAILTEIRNQKAPTSLTVADALNIKREDVSAAVKKLVSQGLIIRHSKNKDNTVVYAITVKGISKLRSNKN